MRRLPKLFALTALLFLSLHATGGEKIRVACIGDSITYGTGIADRENNSYPAQLRSLLGDGYELCAFGKPGATLLYRGHRPFVLQQEFADALAYAGDIALIHLGVNDTDPRDWPNYRDDFTKDYLSIIDSLRRVNPAIRIIIAIPTPLADRHHRFLSGTRDWLGEVRSAVRAVADAADCELVDFYDSIHPFIVHFRDAVHPDKFAAGLMAKIAYSRITGDYGGLALPDLYTDNMVLQRKRPIVITGMADAGERVCVELDGSKDWVIAGADGRWTVSLPAMEAATGLTLSVSTKTRNFEFRNVAIGEVWLCSGQSNMAFPLKDSAEAGPGSAVSIDADLRFFNSRPRWETSNRAWPLEALEEVDKLNYFKTTSWNVSDSLSASSFSAVGFWFGRMLRDSLNVPVGLISNAVGGSTTESWIDRETLEYCMPEILKDWLHNDFIQDWARERAQKNLSTGGGVYIRHPYEPAYLYESAIAPIKDYGIKGVIWYQGESNAHNFEAHEHLFTLLLKSWRERFENPALPFCYVQLSSLDRPSWPWFRDSQRRLLESAPGLGMVVTSDLGDSLDVHYKQKKSVGQRAGLWALNSQYGFTDIVPSGPLFRRAVFSGSEVTIHFDYGEDLCGDTGFELAGTDMIFYKAACRIEGDSAVLSCLEVPSPFYVRYAWAPYTRANLKNGAGLPASTFRTQKHNMNTIKSIAVTPLPEISDREYAKGVSAPFCGSIGSTLIIAGGANFPDKPLLEGGRKKVYRDIWCMPDEGQWTHVGILPDSTAYGATFPTAKGLVLAGGEVCGKPWDQVYLLSLRGVNKIENKNRLLVKKLPPLPEGIGEAGWTSDGGRFFLAGGLTSSGKSDAVYVCEEGKWKWNRIATLPVPLVQPVAFASGDKLYIWGGFNPANSEVYSQGWCLDIASGEWSPAPDIPDGGTFVGASALTLPDGRLFVVGGVNIDIFRKALHNRPEDRIPYLSQEPSAYRFRDTMWVFDPSTKEWFSVGRTGRAALAGAGIIVRNGEVIVAGGEIKPGVRSPFIFKFAL